MKKRLALGVAVLLAILLAGLLVSCGVPQDQYNTAVADLARAQQGLDSTKSELTTAQAKITELTSSQDKTKNELIATQTKYTEATSAQNKTKTELDGAKAEVASLQTKLQAAEKQLPDFKADLRTQWAPLYQLLALNSSLEGISINLNLNKKENIPSLAATATARITALNDSELKSLWEQAYTIDSAGAWRLSLTPFERLLSAVQSRMASRANSIKDKVP